MITLETPQYFKIPTMLHKTPRWHSKLHNTLKTRQCSNNNTRITTILQKLHDAPENSITILEIPQCFGNSMTTLETWQHFLKLLDDTRNSKNNFLPIGCAKLIARQTTGWLTINYCWCFVFATSNDWVSLMLLDSLTTSWSILITFNRSHFFSFRTSSLEEKKTKILGIFCYNIKSYDNLKFFRHKMIYFGRDIYKGPNELNKTRVSFIQGVLDLKTFSRRRQISMPHHIKMRELYIIKWNRKMGHI